VKIGYRRQWLFILAEGIRMLSAVRVGRALGAGAGRRAGQKEREKAAAGKAYREFRESGNRIFAKTRGNPDKKRSEARGVGSKAVPSVKTIFSER
jgi:hypothetical protein